MRVDTDGVLGRHNQLSDPCWTRMFKHHPGTSAEAKISSLGVSTSASSEKHVDCAAARKTMYELGTHEEILTPYGEHVTLAVNLFSARECNDTLQVPRRTLGRNICFVLSLYSITPHERTPDRQA